MKKQFIVYRRQYDGWEKDRQVALSFSYPHDHQILRFFLSVFHAASPSRCVRTAPRIRNSLARQAFPSDR